MKKTYSIQMKILAVLLLAIIAISFVVSTIGIIEIDSFIETSSKRLVTETCEKEAAAINFHFSDMEKSVSIMKNYLMDLIKEGADVTDEESRKTVITRSQEMFHEIAKSTDDTVAYYIRFDPSISNETSGFFYSKTEGGNAFIKLTPTDLSLYDQDDTEHVGWFWEPYYAGEPIWMKPYFNENNGIMMISYVIPMYFEGDFIGVVGMDFGYDRLTDTVDEITIYEHGVAHLESNGTIAYHKNIATGSPAPDLSGEFMQVSEDLKNGMSLVLSASYSDIREIKYEIITKIVIAVTVLVVFFSAFMILVVRQLVRPLKKLTGAAEQLSKGNYDVEVGHSNTKEIELLSRAFENMTVRLHEHDKQQRFLAYRDSLTGLRNTTSYKIWISDFEKEIKEGNARFGVVIFDVNFLKETNDRYGHDTGNKIIVAAADLISEVFKRSPVFRIGGDEFAVMLQNRDLLNFAELRESFLALSKNKKVETGGEQIPLSIAFGAAFYDPDTDDTFVDVFNRADTEMYNLKKEMKGLG